MVMVQGWKIIWNMDFKIAGTEWNHCYQLDLKIEGLCFDLMEEALSQAKDGRKHILGEIDKSIKKAWAEIS